MGFPVAQIVKNLPAMHMTQVQSLCQKDPVSEKENGNPLQYSCLKSPMDGRTNGNPLQYSCLESPMDRRTLVDYSPWGHKESDMTERLTPRDKKVEKVASSSSFKMGINVLFVFMFGNVAFQSFTNQIKWVVVLFCFALLVVGKGCWGNYTLPI